MQELEDYIKLEPFPAIKKQPSCQEIHLMIFFIIIIDGVSAQSLINLCKCKIKI